MENGQFQTFIWIGKVNNNILDNKITQYTLNIASCAGGQMNER